MSSRLGFKPFELLAFVGNPVQFQPWGELAIIWELTSGAKRTDATTPATAYDVGDLQPLAKAI